MIFELPPCETDAFLTLDDVYRKGIEMAQNLFIQNGILPPTFLAVRSDGQARCYVLDCDRENWELLVFPSIKSLFRQDEIVRFAYFGEAWIVLSALRNEDGSRVDLKAIKVDQDDRRQTCLQIVAADHHGENRGCAILTQRKDNEVVLGEMKRYDDNAAGGAFTQILDSAPRVLN